MILDDYDWNDYINRYEDLKKANILTKYKACNHWTNFGRHENRILKLKINDDLKEKINDNLKDKILLIIALHTNNDLKYKTLLNNIKYFEKDFIDIILINTIDYKDSYNFDISSKIINSLYIPNDKYCDFGKWTYVLKNIVSVNKYKKIIFTNDSYIIVNNLDEYLNNVLTKNFDLYGYTDSCEVRYHYQSYIFSIDASKNCNFLNIYANHSPYINNFFDLIINFELNLINYFENKICYLNIASQTQGKNIFFVCDKLYEDLLKKNLLPIIKIKRLFHTNKEQIIVPQFINNYLIGKKLY
jgi:hypothetical protein